MITLNHPNYQYVTRFKYLRNLVFWARKKIRKNILKERIGRSAIPLSQELELKCHYCSKRWNIKIIPATWVDNNTACISISCIYICGEDKCKMTFLLAGNYK